MNKLHINKQLLLRSQSRSTTKHYKYISNVRLIFYKHQGSNEAILNNLSLIKYAKAIKADNFPIGHDYFQFLSQLRKLRKITKTYDEIFSYFNQAHKIGKYSQQIIVKQLQHQSKKVISSAIPAYGFSRRSLAGQTKMENIKIGVNWKLKPTKPLTLQHLQSLHYFKNLKSCQICDSSLSKEEFQAIVKGINSLKCIKDMKIDFGRLAKPIDFSADFIKTHTQGLQNITEIRFQALNAMFLRSFFEIISQCINLKSLNASFTYNNQSNTYFNINDIDNLFKKLDLLEDLLIDIQGGVDEDMLAAILLPRAMRNQTIQIFGQQEINIPEEKKEYLANSIVEKAKEHIQTQNLSIRMNKFNFNIIPLFLKPHTKLKSLNIQGQNEQAIAINELFNYISWELPELEELDFETPTIEFYIDKSIENKSIKKINITRTTGWSGSTYDPYNLSTLFQNFIALKELNVALDKFQDLPTLLLGLEHSKIEKISLSLLSDEQPTLATFVKSIELINQMSEYVEKLSIHTRIPFNEVEMIHEIMQTTDFGPREVCIF